MTDKKPELDIQDKDITKQMKKIISESAIIKNYSDAFVLENFFYFTYTTE